MLRFFCLILAGISLLLLSSCNKQRYDYAVLGADEFVCDSYKIREGKLTILEMEGRETGELTAQDLQEYRDVIVEDDILNIAVYHPKRKDLMQSIEMLNENIGGFRVYRGQVSLPDLPPIYIAGLTLEEARELLQEHFREHVQDVELYVTYRDRLQRKVELIGLVNIPTIPVDGKIRLYEVLSKAHIAPEANLFMSYVVRHGIPLAIDLHKLIHEGDMCQNIVMRGGDKIFIANPSDATVIVMGEVRMPQAVNLLYGFMSLRQVLVSAGGIPFTGDLNSIQVIRGNLQCPKIYNLTWDHIIHLPNDSLLLMPGDTVYVSATAITEWNRFIDQLLPSFRGFRESFDTYRVTWGP
jgi:polysaccharide export outer membrane protein